MHDRQFEDPKSESQLLEEVENMLEKYHADILNELGISEPMQATIIAQSSDERALDGDRIHFLNRHYSGIPAPMPSSFDRWKKIQDSLLEDQIMFGRCVVKTNPDGSIERLDPMTDIDELMKNNL